MTDSHWSDALARMGACLEALKWCHTQPSAAAAWETCARPDWMFWIAGRAKNASGKEIAVAACAIARRSLPYVTLDEDRPRIAIETAERFLAGKAARKELSEAEATAWAAARAAAGEAARAAAWAVAQSRPRITPIDACDLIRAAIPMPELN